MCRHLAYVGPPISLSRLLFEPPHSLSHQSWAPRDMRGGGTINADGFGVGWHTADGPVRYRRAGPLWSDPDLPALARSVRSGGVLAAVRSATVGMPVTPFAAAPFNEGPWFFSHNGVVAGWPASVEKAAAALPLSDLLTLDAPTDSALLWALVRDRLRRGSGLFEAVADTVASVAALAPGSRLNLLLTDGTTVVASTVGHALSVLTDDHSVLVSSEPLDANPAWRPVPDGTILVATPGSIEQIPLNDRLPPPTTTRRPAPNSPPADTVPLASIARLASTGGPADTSQPAAALRPAAPSQPPDNA